MKGEVPVRVKRIFSLLRKLSEYPPKTAKQLADTMSVSLPVIYKDLIIIENMGYDLESDTDHRFFLKFHGVEYYKLDEDEKKLIIGAVKKSGANALKVKSIQQKLRLGQLPTDLAAINTVKQLQSIQLLLTAIQYKWIVILKSYRSTTPGSKTRDRKVIPLYFDENKMNIRAFSLEDRDIRIFKIARFDSVEATEEKQDFKLINEMPEIDAFGFGGQLIYSIDVLMTKLAYALLIEEFPDTASNVTELTEGIYRYHLQIKVCGYEGVGRFVMGLITEVKVLGEPGFKEYLKTKIENSSLFT
jgi:proteasome accessory factor C